MGQQAAAPALAGVHRSVRHVFHKDGPEDDVLVLGGVHLPLQLVRSGPKFPSVPSWSLLEVPACPQLGN